MSQAFGSMEYDQVLTYDAAAAALTPAADTAPATAYFVHLRAASTFSPALPRDPTTRFVYDGEGGRVQQITAAGTTTYLGEHYEIGPDGTTTTYVFAGSQRLAALTQSPSHPDTPSLRFFLTDHLGSTHLVTDATGAVVECAEYTPYGSVVTPHSALRTPNSFGFTGQRLDASTGLYFYHARYYDPDLGRFMSADPLVQAPGDPQTLNRYAYCRNNPVNLVDPSGLKWSWSKFFGIVAIAAAIIVTAGVAAPAIAGAAGVVGGAIEAGVGAAVSAAAAAVPYATVIGIASTGAYFATPTSAGNTPINAANPAGLNTTTLAQPSSLSLPGRGPSLLGQAVDSVLTPMYNSLVRPGWNYGEYLADLDAGRGVINPHLYGAMVDSLLVISNVAFTFEQAVVYGPQRSPFWRYVGPKSDPAGTWVVRGSRPSYGTDYELAMERLSARNQWSEVKQASVPWDQYVAGPRPAAPQFGHQGFGLEYRVGGFGDWKGYVGSWWNYWKNQLFANSQ